MKSVILKIDSCTSQRNKRNTHDCRDIGGFLEVILVWIHPIHKNLCRTQWPRVGNNMDSRDNSFIYDYRTLPLKANSSSLDPTRFVHYFLGHPVIPLLSFPDASALGSRRRVYGGGGGRGGGRRRWWKKK